MSLKEYFLIESLALVLLVASVVIPSSAMDASPPRPIARRRIGFWLTGFLLLSFIYFLPRPADWNQDTRLDLTLAIVNRGTVQIDAYKWNTGDWARHGRHYYIDKAPGLSLVDVPVAAVYKLLISATVGRKTAEEIGLRRSWHKDYLYFYLLQSVETWYTVAFPGALLMLLFFWFLAFLSSSLFNRVALTLALGLATMVFPYAQVLYAHIPAALLLFAGFCLIYVVAYPDRQRGPRAVRMGERPALPLFLAGLLLGVSVIFDHTCAFIALIIGLWSLLRLPLRLVPWLAAGAVPAALALLAYDYVAFHDPFVTGYSTVGPGVGGSDSKLIPHLDALWGMSFSPYRGLFFLSPFLLLAFPGYVIWARRGDRDWLLFLAVPLLFFLLIATYSYWPGGSSVGPRYLVPALPFLAAPIVLALDAARGVALRAAALALALLSLLNVWAQSVGGNGYPALPYLNPLFDHSLPLLGKGDVAVSLGTIFLLPFTGRKSLLTILPILVFWALWCWYALRPRKVRGVEESGDRLRVEAG